MTAHDGTIHRRTTKWCPKCEQELPLEKFYARPERKDGRDGYCKACKNATSSAWSRKNAERVRRNRIKRSYGMDQEQFDLLLKSQMGRCAICSRELIERIHVDHDHSTSIVRGLLCHSCNVGLGFFKDDVSILSNAIEYLKPTLP
jgi:hypothetical protein